MAAASRHYLFAMWEGAGLVAAELGVARQLIERGHRVTVLADPPIEAEAVAIGAGFRAWERAPVRASRDPADDLVADWETSSPFELMKRMRERFVVDPADRFAADVTAMIAEIEPDVVVSDVLLLGAHVAAEASGLPAVALIPNVYIFPAPGSPPFGTGWAPPRSAPARLRARLVDRLTVRLWDKGLPTLNRLRADHGLPPVATLWEQLDRLDRVLVLTSPTFDVAAELPANVHYVGPQLADPSWVDTGWEPPAGDGPLVLVSLSSGFQDQLETLRRIVAALGELPVRAVVTTGLAIAPDALPAPDTIQVVRSAPHSLALRHADAVVTHAGHATLLKSLLAGVPVVCLPMGRDQGDNAARLVATGAGLRISKAAKPRAIAAAVRRVLDEPRYRSAAAAVQQRLRDEETTPSQVVGHLEALSAHDGAVATVAADPEGPAHA